MFAEMMTREAIILFSGIAIDKDATEQRMGIFTAACEPVRSGMVCDLYNAFP